MMLDEVRGDRLSALVRDALAETAAPVSPDDPTFLPPERSALYQALLEEPLCVPLVGPGASPGPTLRIGASQEATHPIESISLGARAVACFPDPETLAEHARAQKLWPDEMPRAEVYPEGSLFPHLLSHPGAVLVVPEGNLALDAGEVAALAARLAPADLSESLRKLVTSGQGREVARRLANRMLYVIGHPRGGMVMFQRELAVFFHRWQVERFTAHLSREFGQRPEHALVAASELFQYALRGKITVVVAPGPEMFRLRPMDLRITGTGPGARPPRTPRS